jgi:hypothetical protein
MGTSLDQTTLDAIGEMLRARLSAIERQSLPLSLLLLTVELEILAEARKAFGEE